jgi:hypothetical protein
MSEKVKLTAEQAKKIIQLQKDYTNERTVSEFITTNPAARKELTLDTLIRALYIGYEVEETPEERIKETFERFESSEVGREVGFAGGIKFVLNELGIKIDGVNT